MPFSEVTATPPKLQNNGKERTVVMIYLRDPNLTVEDIFNDESGNAETSDEIAGSYC